jgi:hypothetical protein
MPPGRSQDRWRDRSPAPSAALAGDLSKMHAQATRLADRDHSSAARRSWAQRGTAYRQRIGGPAGHVQGRAGQEGGVHGNPTASAWPPPPGPWPHRSRLAAFGRPRRRRRSSGPRAARPRPGAAARARGSAARPRSAPSHLPNAHQVLEIIRDPSDRHRVRQGTIRRRR